MSLPITLVKWLHPGVAKVGGVVIPLALNPWDGQAGVIRPIIITSVIVGTVLRGL